jgi:hypothetical protein
VVASASNPIAASSFAVPASQGLGMMKALARACSARNASAFSIWVRIGKLAWLVGRVGGGEPSGLAPINQICYFSISHQLFAWMKHGQRCASHLPDRSPPRRHFECCEGAAPLAAAISRRIALLEQELGVPLFERIAGVRC